MDATKKLTEEYKSKNTFRYVKDGIEYTTPAFDFHIFSTEAILSAHTNGNIATKDLDAGGQGFGASQSSSLKLNEENYIQNSADNITQIKSDGNNKRNLKINIVEGQTLIINVDMIGVDKDYFSVMGYTVQTGRLFGSKDWDECTKSVILDNVAANTLFASENPIGKTLEIKGEPFIIVGVVEQIDGFTPKVTNINDWYTYYGNTSSGQVFITDVNWPLIFSFDEPYNLVVKPAGTDAMTNAGKKTADIMNNYMPATSNENGSDSNEDSGASFKYKSEDLLEKAKAMQEVSASTSQQLIWIASISLLVGGIGVMNIMLVSVTERTREIGLKKALGARKSVILMQFLTEAAVLTSMGGIIGVGAGVGLAYLISDVASVPVAISGAAIAVSVIFSMVIGIVFGFIPSVKASNLNPIDALRYE